MNNDETNNFGKGAIDLPADFLKPEAFQHSEIAGAFQPAAWEEKDMHAFLTYPKRNQGTTGACVSYTLSKQLAVDELSENGAYRELSPRSIYPYTFLPGGGSSSVVASKLAVKQGMTLEALLPTDGLIESDIEKDTGYATDAKQVALVYRPDSFIECSADFETIASILQSFRAQGQKKVVAITLMGQNNGTWLTPMPTAPGLDPSKYWYHRVPVTDFGRIGGREVLSIDNSWGAGIGLMGQQFLTKEYEPFIYGAIYTLNKPDNWQSLLPATVPMPRYQWSADLQTGSTGADVTALQTALQSMGMFPISAVVKPTGNFFGVTRKAVELFQASFGLPVTGMVDAVTRLQLNTIFKG